MGEEIVLSEGSSTFRRGLGERVKRYRNKEGLDQLSLALAVGYRNASAISELEKGNLNTTLDRIEALAVALHVTPQDLLFDERAASAEEAVAPWISEMTQWVLRTQASDYVTVLRSVVNELEELEKIKKAMT